MPSEHGSRLAPDLIPGNLSLSVHMQLYVHLLGQPRGAVAPPTRAYESRVRFWHSSPVLTQLAHLR